tara:strand:+ start:2536 stop:3057 length:522 start_codon:yes stop_codon:yes gene_type:complete
MNYIYFKQLSILIILLFVVACGNDNDTINSVEENQILSVTTTNVNVSDFYYNFSSQSEVNIEDAWDIGIVIDTENYNMPSFVPGDVQVAVYENEDFNNLTTIPTTYLNDVQSDHSVFGYGGSYEVLSYDITVHKVSVTNPNYIYLIKSDNDVFKLQFVEYLSGITVFQFAEIN